MDKLIRKEQIVQLREHDMNRGHNKSKTPVYPVTVPEAILGFDNLGGATIVETLPETGRAGIIYYNTEDSNYYVYTENGFKGFGAQEGLPIVQASTVATTETETEGAVSVQVTYYDLEPNVYYLFGTIAIMNLRFPLYEDDINIAASYVGRFKCQDTQGSTVTIHLGNGVHFADNIPDIEPGHTYEFNILYDTCLITDITHTS